MEPADEAPPKEGASAGTTDDLARTPIVILDVGSGVS
jgi:hypothetical protein